MMSEQASKGELPDVLQAFVERYPEVWEAYERLGEAATGAGPLDARAQRLVKLAIAIGVGRRGAVRSHARRALKAGLTPEELIHVGILAITTLGWSGAFMAITWIQEVVAHARGGDRPSSTGKPAS